MRLPVLIAVGLLVFLAAPAARAALKFAPHEAVYDLQLDQNRPNSQVLRADGKLTFALNDACDGWTTDQKLEISFLYAMGQQSKLVVTTSSWEAKDGSRYTFASRTLSNGQETESYRGKARLTPEGGEAIYSQPKDRKIKIAGGTIFPNQHSIMILHAAMAGQKVPNQLVFDGTDSKAQSDVSVFLSRPVALQDDKNVPEKLRDNPLLQGQAYPTHLAFFALNDPPDPATADIADEKESVAGSLETGTPDYELKLDLLPNSVARRLMIDYGSFTMRGHITDIKNLPSAGCP